MRLADSEPVRCEMTEPYGNKTSAHLIPLSFDLLLKLMERHATQLEDSYSNCHKNCACVHSHFVMAGISHPPILYPTPQVFHFLCATILLSNTDIQSPE